MSKVNVMILNDSIVVNFDAKTLTVNKADSRYADIIDAFRKGDLAAIPALTDIEKAFKDDRLTLIDSVVHVDGSALPEELSARLLKFREERLPYDALVKFWDNLKSNPSFNARKMLYKFLEHNGHPLTAEGEFIAYRGVSEDFKDKHSGKFDNSPGSVCEMPRDQVDDNPNNTCSTGLHVACFDYAKDFGAKLVEVKVNPADVVAVPTDYEGTKMRVSRFEVVQEVAVMRTETLYGVIESADSDGLEDETSDDLEEEYCEHCDSSEHPSEYCDETCANCNTEKTPFAKFCGECGHEI